MAQTSEQRCSQGRAVGNRSQPTPGHSCLLVQPEKNTWVEHISWGLQCLCLYWKESFLILCLLKVLHHWDLLEEVLFSFLWSAFSSQNRQADVGYAPACVTPNLLYRLLAPSPRAHLLGLLRNHTTGKEPEYVWVNVACRGDSASPRSTLSQLFLALHPLQFLGKWDGRTRGTCAWGPAWASCCYTSAGSSTAARCEGATYIKSADGWLLGCCLWSIPQLMFLTLLRWLEWKGLGCCACMSQRCFVTAE